MKLATILRRLLFLLVVLAALSLAYRGLRQWLDRPPEVDVAPVEQGAVERILAVTGRIRPRLVNSLRPVVSARLVTLEKMEGDPVAPGELLARLDDRAPRSELEQARSEVDREAAELDQRRRELARARELAGEELIPPSELERAALEVKTAEERLDALAEAVREAEVRLDDYELRSPIDGFVLERPVDPGQTVGPSDTIYEIAALADPWIEAEVDERYLAELAVDLPARVSPLGGRRESYDARGIYVSKRIDRLSGAAIVRLEFTGAAPTFPAGLTLDVNLIVEEHGPGTLTVPRAAVAGLGGPQTWVLVASEGRAERREVEVIDWPADRLVLLSGLEAGEWVVLEPQRFEDGQEIHPREVEGAL